MKTEQGDLKVSTGFHDWGDMCINQGMLAATRSWRREGMGSPLETLEKLWPCRHAFDFGLVILVLDF